MPMSRTPDESVSLATRWPAKAFPGTCSAPESAAGVMLRALELCSHRLHLRDRKGRLAMSAGAEIQDSQLSTLPSKHSKIVVDLCFGANCDGCRDGDGRPELYAENKNFPLSCG